MKSKGFTVVEGLILMAIIGILLAIAIPAFQRKQITNSLVDDDCVVKSTVETDNPVQHGKFSHKMLVLTYECKRGKPIRTIVRK